MRVVGDWLGDPATQAVLRMLGDGGHRALCVGGCVRNALLGVPVTDVDIATDAEPARVAELAQAAGLRAVPTGIDHGTITVVAGGQGFEITTFRRDVETWGRHARVAFTAELEHDAARRDFTINALYAQADGTVIDPLAGLGDLLARRVRFVGDPVARIAEDHLRILRFFRFHAQYGDPDQGLDADALAACAEHADSLSRLSRERIGAEMRKLLAAPDPAPAVAAMAACGVLAQVLPGADARALPVLVHLEPAPGGWLRRLAVLGGDADLRLSRHEARDLDALRAAIASPAPPLELGWRLGAGPGTDAVLARAALLGDLPAGWADDIARGAVARFPLRAADLPDLRGPALGAALKRAQAHWLDHDLRPDRDALRAIALGGLS